MRTFSVVLAAVLAIELTGCPFLLERAYADAAPAPATAAADATALAEGGDAAAGSGDGDMLPGENPDENPTGGGALDEMPVPPAEDSGATTPVEPDPSAPAEPAPPEPVLSIEAVGICIKDGLNISLLAFADARGPTSYGDVSIEARGGTVDLLAKVYFPTSEAFSNDYVHWSSSNEQVATVLQNGTVTACGDGEATITVSVSSDMTSGGEVIAASVVVKVSGQQDTPYVTAITILDPNGQPIPNPGNYAIEEEIKNLVVPFYALVDVYDPVTGQTTTYNTQNGTLSELTGGAIADLTWVFAPEELGYIEPRTGQFLPYANGNGTISAKSLAGKGGKTVVGVAYLYIDDPTIEAIDSYHPQESLRVLAYYELYPPEDPKNPDDPNYVTNREFSLDEFASLGLVQAAYTTVRSGSYITTSAEGVPVATILRAAGVNLEGVQALEFGTWDTYSQYVSYSYLFDSPHYYYPNIASQDAPTAGKVQVYPMLAWKSSAVTNGETDPDYSNLNEATRFRLICGATSPTDAGGNLLIKWVHTLYVKLDGGPAVQPGDSDGEGSEGTGSGSGDGEGGGVPGAGVGTPGTGDGAGGSDDGATGVGDGGAGDASIGGSVAEGTVGSARAGGDAAAAPTSSAAAPGSSAGTAGTAGAPADEITDDGTPAAADPGGGAEAGRPKFAVYQVMNNHDSETDRTLAYLNPYAALVPPLSAAALVAGGVWAALWFRRQSRPTPLMAAT